MVSPLRDSPQIITNLSLSCVFSYPSLEIILILNFPPQESIFQPGSAGLVLFL